MFVINQNRNCCIKVERFSIGAVHYKHDVVQKANELKNTEIEAYDEFRIDPWDKIDRESRAKEYLKNQKRYANIFVNGLNFGEWEEEAAKKVFEMLVKSLTNDKEKSIVMDLSTISVDEKIKGWDGEQSNETSDI